MAPSGENVVESRDGVSAVMDYLVDDKRIPWVMGAPIVDSLVPQPQIAPNN